MIFQHLDKKATHDRITENVLYIFPRSNWLFLCYCCCRVVQFWWESLHSWRPQHASESIVRNSCSIQTHWKVLWKEASYCNNEITLETLLYYTGTSFFLLRLDLSALLIYFFWFNVLEGDIPSLELNIDISCGRCRGEFILFLGTFVKTSFFLENTWPIRVLPRDTRVIYLLTTLALAVYYSSNTSGCCSIYC